MKLAPYPLQWTETDRSPTIFMHPVAPVVARRGAEYHEWLEGGLINEAGEVQRWLHVQEIKLPSMDKRNYAEALAHYVLPWMNPLDLNHFDPLAIRAAYQMQYFTQYWDPWPIVLMHVYRDMKEPQRIEGPAWLGMLLNTSRREAMNRRLSKLTPHSSEFNSMLFYPISTEET